MKSRHNKIATFVGFLALLIWSTGALAAIKICQLPSLEVLTFTFFITFITTCLKLTITKRWSDVYSQPWYIWVAGVLGVCMQQLAYISAFKNAPAIQADIIILLWPVLVIFFSGFLISEKLKPQHLFSGALGLLSVFFLNYTDEGFILFSSWYSGYSYALICAVLWSLYTIFTRRFPKVPKEMIGMYYGVGSIFVLTGHLACEDFVMPDVSQGLILAYLGIFVAGGAYFCWDYGIKKGNLKLLATLSYGNSIVSLFLLAFFTQAQLPKNVLWSCALVVVAGFCAAEGSDKKLEIFTKRFHQHFGKLVFQRGLANNILVFILGFPLK